MKRSMILVSLLLSGALALTACTSDQSGTTEEVKETAVYDVAEKNQPEATTDTAAIGNGLNAESADTVKTAKDAGVFTVEDGDFVNHAQGYRVAMIDDLEVVDMGDATYRSTLANDDTRLEIFTQTLDDIDAKTYLSYSNRFLENTWDFTKNADETLKDNGRTTHILAWERRSLSKIEGDRNHYGIVDIVEGDNVYCFLVSSSKAVSTDMLKEIADSVETFEPTVTAKEYPHFARSLSSKTQETQDFYNKYFSDDADLTWGVFEPSVGGTYLKGLIDLENRMEHHFDIALHYSGLKEEYDTSIYSMLDSLWAHGTVCELTVQTELYDPTSQNNAVYDILEGKYDTYIRSLAKDIARFGHPVLFRPFNEMNGDWCNYSAYWSARDCDTYIELYRYLYNIFEEEGANKNTLWIWNPNERSFPNFAWNYEDNYYPGDEYVDIIGLTGYNTGDYYDGETWRSFKEIYDPIYAKIAPQYKQPLMITEFSSSDYGGDKAQWVEDMFTDLKHYPRIKAAVWWNGADKDADGNIARSYYIDNNAKAFRALCKHLKEKDYQPLETDDSGALLRNYRQ
ncbi:MAG: glycosyl hydrolase [Peptococcaceae bacterium]|nr:glycosyl hydrolase [Peptococcaceae bacterium]